ncbi:MAG: hypothetical protein M3Z92_14635 [Bacteroidota bacterium]|nr:hypothetical protein [Bacteroidota bacterium]MDQ6889740.1 hypothetical protein [Bacteroidota bacterium]
MSTLELALYDNLRKKLDDETARQLISFVKEEIREEVNQNNLVTKNDLSQAKIDLVEKMNKDKIDLIKWMFGFWFTLVLLLLANWFLKH